MSTIILAFTGLVLLALFALGKLVKLAWGSPAFWIFATVLTVALFPLTAGMSPWALAALIALRFILVGKLIGATR